MTQALSETVSCWVCKGKTRSAGSKNMFPLYICRTCGHFFVWPMPDDNLRIYSENYFSGAELGFGYVDYDRDKQVMVPTFEKYLDLIESAGAKSGKLLDVGAATGFFLNLARNRGWEPFGVELSDYAASIGRAKGLNIMTGVLAGGEFPESFFDVITLWDVIEHMPDPRSTLRELQRTLKPGGLIAINTPDSSSLIAKALGKSWHLVVPPEHLNLFHRQSLRLLLEEGACTVLMEDKIGKRFTTQYVVQTLAHWMKWKPFEKGAQFLSARSFGRWGVAINLRDNMFVLARKNT